MSKKHFTAVAFDFNRDIEFYRNQRDKGPRSEASYADAAIEALSDLAFKMARTFSEFNPNFDRARFIKACGIMTVA